MKILVTALCSLLLLLVFTLSSAAQVPPFSFAGYRVAAGTRQSLKLPVVAGRDSTYIPVTVLHGAKKGPVLGLVAGVHGYEYPPIIAGQQLGAELDPAQLSGTVLLVHVANVPAFLGRSIYINPVDGKNLNRSFPGTKDGTLTERMAWTLTETLIRRCNYLVDMHAGDGSEDLRPYSAYYNYSDYADLTEQGRQMALALGFDHIVQFGNEARITEPSYYCSREAIMQNIPAVDIECGKLGMVKPEELSAIKNAVFSLMRHLNMLPGQPQVVANPLFIARRSFVSSPHSGIFYSTWHSGEYVKKGMKLGYVTDLSGNHLSDIFAPADGIIIYLIGTPPINQGETLVSIGHTESTSGR
jgi:uncharacterized protein